MQNTSTQNQNAIQQEVNRLNQQFLHSADFIAKEIPWGSNEKVILCYYSSLVKRSEVERYINLLKLEQKREERSKSKETQQQSKEQGKQAKEKQQSNNVQQQDKQQNSSNKTNRQQPNHLKISNNQNKNVNEENQKSSNQTANASEANQANQDSPNNQNQMTNATISNQADQNSQSSQNQNNQNSNSNEDNQTNQDSQSNQNQKTNESTSNQADQNSQSSQNQNNQNANTNEENQSKQHTWLPEDTLSITTEPYDQNKIVEHICNGEALLVILQRNEIIRLISPEVAQRAIEEPANEQVLRGAHEGLIENFDANVSLIRKRFKNNTLVVKKVIIGKESKAEAYYFYLDNLVDKQALKTVEERLNSMDLDLYFSLGQLTDQLDDHVMSPFPQLLNTERPDRVIANISEGKIAVMTENSPTAIIGPVTFFSFYQSPDDFNARPVIGTFYLIVRSVSVFLAVYLPAFYIAIVSFHSDVLPIELANKVKMDINQIPYRPFYEALIMQFTLELIREASVRLPKSIGQTVGIVGGLVIGDAIVSAGLVSNLMVIVVAFTAISSFVIPSIELNTTIRVIGFPFMILASLFGFFGILFGSFLLIIHLLNLSSYNQPYLSPIIPFDPVEFKKIFFRYPYYKATKQATSFSPKDE